MVIFQFYQSYSSSLTSLHFKALAFIGHLNSELENKNGSLISSLLNQTSGESGILRKGKNA